MLNDRDVAIHLENRRLKAFKNKGLLFEGTAKEGLYYVDQPEEQALSITVPEPHVTNTRALWHARTGYASYRYVDKLLECAEGVHFTKPKPGDQPVGETVCEACLAGSIKESFNKSTDNQEQLKVRRLYADIFRIKSRSIRGFRYFLLISDDTTRQSWVILLRDKLASKAVSKFKQLAKQIELESGAKIVFIRSDNRTGEFGTMY